MFRPDNLQVLGYAGVSSYLFHNQQSSVGIEKLFGKFVQKGNNEEVSVPEYSDSIIFRHKEKWRQNIKEEIYVMYIPLTYR